MINGLRGVECRLLEPVPRLFETPVEAKISSL